MKSFLVLTLLLTLGRLVQAADNFPIQVYPCPRANPAPVLDGKLDDVAWQQAPVASGFTFFKFDPNFAAGTPAKPSTSFRVLWDDRFLYLGIRCDEPLMAKITPVRYALDEHAVFRGETIEIFIDPDHSHDRYYQLAFNVAGSLYDGEGMAIGWNSHAAVTTWLGPDFWSAEIAVPWAPMKAKPQAGNVVGLNVNRDRSVGESALSTWACVNSLNGFHDPERFGHLVLSGTPEIIGRLSPEFRGDGGRSGPIVIHAAAGFAQAAQAILAAATIAAGEKWLTDLDAECKRGEKPETVAEIRQRHDDYAAKLTTLKTDLAKAADADERMRLDIALQGLVVTLRKTVWETRLKVVLDNI